MGFFGNLIGQGLGALGSKFLPIPGVDGKTLGGHLGGSFLPFRRGGRVSGGYKKGGLIPKKVVKPYRKGGKVKPKKKK